MKLSLFKKVIREVVREEIEYSLAGLRKELKEVLVSKINDEILNETPTVTTTACLLYTSPSPRDLSTSRMPSSA